MLIINFLFLIPLISVLIFLLIKISGSLFKMPTWHAFLDLTCAKLSSQYHTISPKTTVLAVTQTKDPSIIFDFFLFFASPILPGSSSYWLYLFFFKVNTHVLTTSYHLHYYHCGLNHHHFSLGLRQYFPNWLSGSSLLNPRAREIQLKQSEHASPSVAPRISQSESQVFSRSPMWPAPTLSSTPLPPCLVHSPLLRWALKCSSDSAGPPRPSLKVCAFPTPCAGKAAAQECTLLSLSPPSGLDAEAPSSVTPSLTTYLKLELPPSCSPFSLPLPCLGFPTTFITLWHALLPFCCLSHYMWAPCM